MCGWSPGFLVNPCRLVFNRYTDTDFHKSVWSVTDIRVPEENHDLTQRDLTSVTADTEGLPRSLPIMTLLFTFAWIETMLIHF